MKTWEFKKDGRIITINEIPLDGDLHEFEILSDGEYFGEIVPGDVEGMEEIIADLNENPADVELMEDGHQNSISLDLEDNYYRDYWGKAKYGVLPYYRKRAGLTQVELAEKSGILQPNIARLESGERSLGKASGETLKKLAKALGVDIIDLI